MKTLMGRWLVMFLCSAIWWGCGSTDAEPDLELTSATLNTDVDDARADSPGVWRVKTSGMTMWVDTVLTPQDGDGGTTWKLGGRVSKTMTGFRAYTASGAPFAAKMVSARRFEVSLNRAEVLAVVAGQRIYFDFFARRGTTPMYHGMVRYAARFAHWAGTNSIYVFRAVNPVLVGTNLHFRGRASTLSGFDLQLVYTDDDADPMLFDDEPHKYHFDWTPEALHLAANPPEDPVRFRGADDDSTPIEKTANLEFRIIQIGLGTEPALEAWPRQTCDPEVRECLQNLDTPDTEPCGWANEVQACADDVQLPAAASPGTFASDLADVIRDWYTRHEADVQAMGGRTLSTALRAISADHVGVVDPEEVDLLGYDPAHVDVFFHPDPVFPGSDRVWYGVYDKAGHRITIEPVN